MLVLTRKLGSRLLIGNDIVITILDVSDYGQVKVGITAPKQTVIVREEIKHKFKGVSNGSANQG